MEAKNSRCPMCGANMKKRWVRLTPGLVEILCKIADAVREAGKNEVHIGDMGLTPVEYNSLQQLRYHGLIAKVQVDGKHKQGYWLITSNGGKFLRGETRQPIKVQIFRNRIVDKDEQTAYLKDIRSNGTPYYDNLDAIQFEQATQADVNIHMDRVKKEEGYDPRQQKLI